MSGGTISGNTADYGGGVYNKLLSRFNIFGNIKIIENPSLFCYNIKMEIH